MSDFNSLHFDKRLFELSMLENADKARLKARFFSSKS